MKLPLNNNYKMVIFDIGKTIFDKESQTKISENIYKAIEKLKHKGIKVGVCTMRTYKWCLENIKIALDFYICLNGSYIVCNKKVIFKSRIKNYFTNKNQLNYGKKIAFYKNIESQKLANLNGFVSQKLGFLKSPFVIVLFNIEKSDYDNIKKLYNTYYWKNTKTITVQNRNSSRLQGITIVQKYYNYFNKFLYFGDGPNDLEIFKKFKNCIMMENGFFELEKYALAKTNTCFNDGVFNYLKLISLI